MKILPVDKIQLGMRLGQNICRHDGMLALPRGAMIKQRELDTIKYHTLDYILVWEQENYLFFAKKADNTNLTLNILESAYKQSTLWEEEFGLSLYGMLEDRILSNKKAAGYLNQLMEIDTYSFAHCINISMVVASLLRKEEADGDIAELAFLALLHDVGRIKLDNVFNKEGKLTEEEFSQLTKHPEISHELLRKAGFPEYELKFVSETHERYDGNGYPYRLKGDEISDMAQLIFIADVYNALSSYRPYRGIYAPYDCIQIIEGEKDKMFSEKCVDFFLEHFNPYPIGSTVELSNGATAVVKKTRSRKKMLPVVELVSETTGAQTGLIDLSLQRDLRIRKILESY